MTIWYQKCKGTVTQIKWCQLYFDEGNEPENKKKEDEKKGPQLPQGESRFAARICEFFAIDQTEDF